MPSTEKKNHTFFLPEELVNKYRKYSEQDYISSMNEGVRRAMEEFSQEIEKEILRQKMEEAAEDPQFMEDLENTMKAFKHVDSDTARELAD
ncbi:hypothetical protein [Halarsenatibacter silvermanii]|uniref:CopG family transcriptional regulator / antitoxin EndoAI n=1 Tax=Halarsenatibacter silvermanii TaxID=321763 RepID=A0A1G9TN39_9FIRM|nr:hypothetical protein [Halarsenatibacter silvermanii]SDM49157.1 hypothetical protein SAMN04488692_1438 [Halarsenatibacter silvermanii]